MSKFDCPNRSNHVSSFPTFGLVRCPYCGECYVEAKDGKVAVPSYIPLYHAEPVRLLPTTSGGEVVRYQVTMNQGKEWTVRLASGTGGGWLARDKDLAACLRAAADKLEADEKETDHYHKYVHLRKENGDLVFDPDCQSCQSQGTEK